MWTLGINRKMQINEAADYFLDYSLLGIDLALIRVRQIILNHD